MKGGGRSLARILATCFLVAKAISFGNFESDFSTEEMKLETGMDVGVGTYSSSSKVVSVRLTIHLSRTDDETALASRESNFRFCLVLHLTVFLD